MPFIHEIFTHPNDVPHDLHPATIDRQGTRYKLTGYTTALTGQEQEPASPRPTLQQEIDLLDLSAKWALQNFSCNDNGETIARAIQDSTVLAISDGSYKDSRGTASLVIEGVNKVGRLPAYNVVPGSPEDQCVYRSELAGLYGIVLAVSLVCKVHGVTGGQVDIGCDGLLALQQSFHPDNIPNAPTAPQFDLICAIRRVAKQCPVVWLPRHADGHQDNDLTTILDWHALLNNEMDTGAKAFMFSLPQTLGSDQRFLENHGQFG